jgi:DNA-binding MarR family transcriptional regulator
MEHRQHELPALPASLQRLGAALTWAAENAQLVANRALEPLGLTVKHFGVMTFLRHEAEPPGERRSWSQQAIGERLRIDRTTMVALIDDLERAGYVKRGRNRDDRRAYVITLTAAGRRCRPARRRRSTPMPCTSSDASPSPSCRSSTGCSRASAGDPTSDGVRYADLPYDRRVAYDEELADRIRELVGSESDLTETKMFGGLAFLIGRNMAVAASGQGGILVRVDPEQSDALLARSNARLMEMRGRRMRGWLRVDPEDVRTKGQLAKWVELGTAYARSLPAKR